MKLFFRFLIGISTGFYWSAFNNFLNNCTQDIRAFFSYFSRLTFTKGVVSYEDLQGLAKFAGVFLPRITTETDEGGMRFSKASTLNGGIVNNTIYSERGLLQRERFLFNYIRTDDKEYTTDITDEATNYLQASMIPKDAPILGYIWQGDNFIDSEGLVDISLLRKEPATDRAWTPFYGNQYLRMSFFYLKEVLLDEESFFEYFTAIQRIWYNGENMETLIDITKIICEDFVRLGNLTYQNSRYLLEFNLNNQSLLDNAVTRLSLWVTIISTQFLRIQLLEV